MGKQNKIDAYLTERSELINTMYDCSDKLLASLQTGDLVSAERFDYIREGCWEQIKFIDAKINQTLKGSNKTESFKMRVFKDMRIALNKLTKTSQQVLLSALKIRNQMINTVNQTGKRSEKRETPQTSPNTQTADMPIRTKRPKVAEA